MHDDGFGYLIGAYFHQDWDLESEDGTPDGAITTFIRQETGATVAEACADLAALMVDIDNDADATALLDRLESSYSPRLHGESSLQWLKHIQARLDQASSTAA